MITGDCLFTSLAIEKTDPLRLGTKVDVNELFSYADAIETKFDGSTDHLTAKNAITAGDIDRQTFQVE